MNNNESISYLSNINTKIKNEPKEINNELSKAFHEDLLNFKLSLRKNKIETKIMKIRLKKLNPNISISNRQKLIEYKKLFDINKIREIKDKLLEKKANYMKDIKTIELIHLYSQNINHDTNIQKIFDLNNSNNNNNNLIDCIFNEIIKDINSTSINLQLFDYYLIILGNFFIYTKNIYENNNKDYLNLFLNILYKNSNLEIYVDENFDIINDTLWLIHLYIYFNKKEYLNNYMCVLKNLEYFLSIKFLEILSNIYQHKNNKQLFLTIIKEIFYSIINIYLIIYEEIIEIINIKTKNNNISNVLNISNEVIQNSFNNLINLLNYDIVKNIYNENITDILTLLFSINSQYGSINILNNNFLDIFLTLFDKYKYESFDNNKISQNLIIILNKLIDNYYDCELFCKGLKDSDILPICIQYFLKNGSLLNIALITLNLLFKYQINYNKIIIKCINYKLIDNVIDIFINTENNEKNCYNCLNILINSYYFLKTNMKNPEKENIIKYFNINNNGLISKLEQLVLNDNKDIVVLSSILYNEFNNYENYIMKLLKNKI